MISPGVSHLLDRIAAWANQEPQVRAVAIVGSHARVDHPADRWSDLDVLLFVENPDRLLEDLEWIDSIAEPWLSFLEKTAAGDRTERRVLFAGGAAVDFIPLPSQLVQVLAQEGLPEYAEDVFRRGMRVVVDKCGLERVLACMEIPAAQKNKPSPEEFGGVVNDFLYHAVWTVKRMMRGELWVAKTCCDVYMKGLLLRLMEWHTCASDPRHQETWYKGRFLEEWCDASVQRRLPQVFAYYDRPDLERALFATINLFADVAADTAKLLLYDYDRTSEQRIRSLIRAYLTLDQPGEFCHGGGNE